MKNERKIVMTGDEYTAVEMGLTLCEGLVKTLSLYPYLPIDNPPVSPEHFRTVRMALNRKWVEAALPGGDADTTAFKIYFRVWTPDENGPWTMGSARVMAATPYAAFDKFLDDRAKGPPRTVLAVEYPDGVLVDRGELLEIDERIQAENEKDEMCDHEDDC